MATRPDALRATIDSNVLVYAELEPETERGVLAARAIQAAAPRGIVAVQALLEFVAVIRRRRPDSLVSAFSKVEAWCDVFETAPTTTAVLTAARKLVVTHRFQVWDAVIWSASRAAGASVFLSEDLQNGLVLDGMRVVDPFELSSLEIDALFA